MNGRECRDEDIAEEEEEDAVTCDCTVDAFSEKIAHKIGGKNVHMLPC